MYDTINLHMAVAFIEITAENYIDKINNTKSYMLWTSVVKTKLIIISK